MIQDWTKDVKTWILWGTGDEPSETSNDIDSPGGPELEDIEDNETESNEAHAMNNERDTNGKDTPSSSTPKEDVISVALLTNLEAYASHMEEISLQKKGTNCQITRPMKEMTNHHIQYIELKSPIMVKSWRIMLWKKQEINLQKKQTERKLMMTGILKNK